MIKFFRKIRQNLLVEGITGKYLKYAVGEILLVVFGILIALQINNWNEDRIDDKIERKALLDLLQEFQSNKITFDEHFDLKQEHDVKLNEFISIVRKQEILDTMTNLRLPPLSRKTFDPSMGMVNSIMNSDKIDKLENDSLRVLLSNWKFLLQDFKEEEESLYQYIFNVLKPYEASLFPYSMRKYDSSFTILEIDDYRRNAFMDMKYQNHIIQIHSEVRGQVREGEKVSNDINQIIRLLKKELNK
tara:strand:- start:478 stop:1212 length:735 start_codon:yes stop_codon:yes gene_type:complete